MDKSETVQIESILNKDDGSLPFDHFKDYFMTSDKIKFNDDIYTSVIKNYLPG